VNALEENSCPNPTPPSPCPDALIAPFHVPCSVYCVGGECKGPNATSCATDSRACLNNYNGQTTCYRNNCQRPNDSCVNDSFACDVNTNNKTNCHNGTCTLPNVKDCSGDSNLCSTNTDNTIECLDGTCVVPNQDSCEADETICGNNRNGKVICRSTDEGKKCTANATTCAGTDVDICATNTDSNKVCRDGKCEPNATSCENVADACQANIDGKVACINNTCADNVTACSEDPNACQFNYRTTACISGECSLPPSAHRRRVTSKLATLRGIVSEKRRAMKDRADIRDLPDLRAGP
jgi:hypothetical protein